jgi:DNA (cytosine-5)-methyltransferase 1
MRMKASVTMRYGSVCSGIEAASVAWHPLGWEAAFFSEIEAFPSAVLAHHYPKVENRGDMTKFKRWPNEPIDVLVGGTPCQSFSVAGLRKGLADPRGNLALVFLAIADRLRPRWVVWENVPGVLSSISHDAPAPRQPKARMGGEGQRVETEDEYDREELHAFNCFLAGLSELGYGWAYRVLDAQYFGVPQRRRRVFVVGYLGDWRRAGAVLLERESLCGNPPPSREAGQRASHCLKGGSGSRGWENGAETADGLIEVSPTLRGRPNSSHRADSMAYVHATPPLSKCLNGKGGSLRMDAESETLIPSGGGFDVAHSLKADGFDASEDGTGRGVPMTLAIRGRGDSHDLEIRQDGQANAILTPNGGRAGIGVGAVAFDTTQVTSKANRSNPKPGDPCHPLAAGAHAPTIAGMSVRRLTPRECERLQGFPDDYTLVPYRKKPAADGPRYKALGNSMAVPVMNWIGRRIEAVEAIR